MINCSSLDKPAWTWCKYPSMFIDVHVNVTIPGLSLYSKSSKCGTSRDLVFGLIFETILSYSLSTNESSLLFFLNLSSCNKTILALSVISMLLMLVPILDRHLASLIKVKISLSKLTYNLLLEGCLMIKVACKPALALSTS